jgi:hypothetical protein
MTTTTGLTWTRRHGQHQTVGLYGPHELQATVYRQADGQWALLTFTFNRILDREKFGTLAEAKARAAAVAHALDA